MEPAEVDDPRPTYQRLADDLRVEIANGNLPPGSRVPSVRKLAERYGVAQMTASQALQTLQREGLVFTSAGRGSFVRAEAAKRAARSQDSLAPVIARLDDLEVRVRLLEERTQGIGPE